MAHWGPLVASTLDQFCPDSGYFVQSPQVVKAVDSSEDERKNEESGDITAPTFALPAAVCACVVKN